MIGTRVVANDAQDIAAGERVVLARLGIHAIGPVDEVVARTSLRNCAADVEVVRVVDVEIDDFIGGLFVVGRLARGYRAVAIGHVVNLNLTGFPARVQRVGDHIVIDTAGNRVVRGAVINRGKVTGIVVLVEPAEELCNPSRVGVTSGPRGQSDPRESRSCRAWPASRRHVVLEDKAACGAQMA